MSHHWNTLMEPSTRPPLRRFLVIERSVRSGAYPNSESLADELEVDSRTVQRDIAFLKDQLGAPLEFCRKRNGYHLTDLSWTLPAFQLTEGELVSVFLAERLIRQYRGTPFETDLARAFDRIASARQAIRRHRHRHRSPVAGREACTSIAVRSSA